MPIIIAKIIVPMTIIVAIVSNVEAIYTRRTVGKPVYPKDAPVTVDGL